MKKTAVVICPGRGSYNRDELGYLKRYHADKKSFIHEMDAYRQTQNQPSISELDGAERYKMSLHTRGDHASALIYTCALADYASIDRDTFEIVAITGNSMGWYLALAAAGACNLQIGMHLVNTMGTLMHNEAEGGQLLFPLCNEQWLEDENLKTILHKTIATCNEAPGVEIYQSIKLGGMAVIAANDAGITALTNKLPKVQDKYPMVLPNHAAFHSPLMQSISAKAMNVLCSTLFQRPKFPLIDGNGKVWQPSYCDLQALHNYTFGQQVCDTYNYDCAIEVACKEFAPDHLIILGPGASLGPPTAQQLIKMQWLGMRDKTSFKTQQTKAPFILSMGIEAQRELVLGSR